MTKKKQKTQESLIFTTNIGTAVWNPDGTRHFIDNPAEEDKLWVTIGCKPIGRGSKHGTQGGV
jgi:hypothetical protein